MSKNTKAILGSMQAMGLLKLNLQHFAEGGEPADTKTLLGEIKNATGQLSEALKKQDTEIKQFGQTTDKTANLVKEMEGKYEALQTDLQKAKADMDEFAKKFNRPGFNQDPEQVKSAGEIFTSSEEFKQMQKEGQVRRGLPIGVKSFFPGGRKDLTSATAAGAGNGGLLITPYRAETVMGLQRRLTIRDLLNTQPIGSNAVEYVREVGFTNNAGYRPEGTAAAQSSIEFALETASAKTISHWMPASREVLNDAPRLRNLIDNRMIYGVQSKEEAAILYGDGTNGALLGLMNDTDVQTLAATMYYAGDTRIDMIRRAMTRVTLAEMMATGVILNPLDWEEIELAKGSDGHYIWLNIATGNGPQLFKIPVIETAAMQEGDFLTGAFGMGAQLYDREEAHIRFSESHADFFTRGMVAILAEERLIMTTERPEAFVKGDFTVAGTKL